MATPQPAVISRRTPPAVALTQPRAREPESGAVPAWAPSPMRPAVAAPAASDESPASRAESSEGGRRSGSAGAPQQSALLADLEARNAERQSQAVAPAAEAAEAEAAEAAEAPAEAGKDALRAACQEVRRAGLDRGALRTVRAYLQNLSSAPDDPKFRTLRKENKAFAKALAAAPGVLGIFAAVGFADHGETLQLPTGAPDRTLLWDALAKVDVLLQLCG